MFKDLISSNSSFIKKYKNNSLQKEEFWTILVKQKLNAYKSLIKRLKKILRFKDRCLFLVK